MNITQIWLSTRKQDKRPELPEPIVDAMDSVAECLCLSGKKDSEYRFYDNETVENFLKANYDSKVFDAYNSLQSLAYRCDLARYCILYKLGGWYVDCGITWIQPINVPEHVKLIAFRSVGRYAMNGWSCDNGVIYAEAGHPALECAINNVIDNVVEGSILVFHNNKKSLNNLKLILEDTLVKLKEKGFVFSTTW